MEEPRDTYTVIPGWTKRLGLSLVEKVVYCVIYGFSQDADSTFHGSRAYLASVAECSLRTIDTTLRSLTEKKLIYKREKFVGGVKFCEYYANFATGENISLPVQKLHLGSEKIAHNNDTTIVVSNNDKIENSAPARAKEFNFKNSLIEMGVTEQHAADWLAVRKVKRMTNTRTAFDRLKAQIEKACKQYNITPDACVAFAASKDWGGFDAAWEGVKEITNTNTVENDDEYIRRRFAAEAAKYRDAHF